MGRALGEFEQLILFALVELEDEAYGASIGRAIEERGCHVLPALDELGYPLRGS